MACLHLAQRCAEILSSIQAEVEIAGAAVAATLQDPMKSLIVTFTSIGTLVQKSVNSKRSPLHYASYLLNRLVERPFIKRYLQREEIQLQISEAHERLTDDLYLFGVSLLWQDANAFVSEILA